MNGLVYQWCSSCKESFPMRRELHHSLEKCGNTFFCPKGHTLYFSQSLIVSQRDSWQKTADRRLTTINRMARSEESLRGVRTRQRNRLLRGACPYCSKTPKDLVRHINDKHGPKAK